MFISCWDISIVFIVHPHFANTLAIDSNVFFRNWEIIFYYLTGQYVETYQGLRINVESVRKGDVCYCLQSQWNFLNENITLIQTTFYLGSLMHKAHSLSRPRNKAMIPIEDGSFS